MAIPCMFSSEVHLTLLFSLVFKKKSWRKFFQTIIIKLVTDPMRSLIVLSFKGGREKKILR